MAMTDTAGTGARAARSVFKDRSVLVTGHTGFKGGWLSLWLKELGASVVGYSLMPPTKPSFFEAVGLEGHMTHVVGDIKDREKLAKVMKDHRPEIIFHLAAQPLVRRSYKFPAETFETNVIGTANVLEAIRATPGVRVGMMITSDKCYENMEWVHAYRENDRLGGHDPYSASKGAAEMVIQSYRNSFFPPEKVGEHGVSVASVRAGNVIGGGDWAEDRIIPDAVRSLVEGRPVQVRNPFAVRPWQFVLEPLSGYLLLAARMWEEPGSHASAWNFGPTSAENVTVQDLVSMVVRQWGSGTVEDASDKYRGAPHEAAFLKLDCTKAANLLGWRPAYDVATSVKETVDWYKAFEQGKADEKEMYRISVEQVRNYADKAPHIRWKGAEAV